MQADVELVKPALLYADKVRLLSPLANLVMGVASLGQAEGAERARTIVQLAEVVGQPLPPEMDQILVGLETIDSLPRSQRRKLLGAQRAKEIRQMLERLEDAWGELRVKVDEMLSRVGLDQLLPALEIGVLEVEPLVDPSKPEIDEMIAVFVEKLGGILSGGITYPLFDDRAGDLIRAGIAEGLFVPSADALDRGREVGAASEFMHYLPAFPPASVAEILDLRRELQSPLVRFRAAMVRVGNAINAASHEEEFRGEVERIYREEVAPAIEELREAVETNKYLWRLVGQTLKEDLPKWLGAGVLALAVTPTKHVDDLIVAGATVVQPAVKAAWEKYVSARDIRQHQYYFLYETDTRLRS